jgi:hypothetical protein
MLTLTAYATLIGKSNRTVLRYLDAGLIPGAVKIGREWSIPASALPPVTHTTSHDVSPVTHAPLVTHTTSHDTTPVPRTIPPGLWELEDVARFYGTSVSRVRLMGEHPRSPFVVGRYGPGRNAPLRVWVL